MASFSKRPAPGPANACEPSPLAPNLRHLCGFHPSISSVCRALGINRQQFNKYLSGCAIPSVFLLGKIARFFGVNTEELFLPHAAFRQKFAGPAHDISLHTRDSGGGHRRKTLDEFISLAGLNHDILRRYAGYYFRYYYDYSSSGCVVRSLFRVTQQDNVFVTRFIERVPHRSNSAGRLTTFKYEGVLVALSGCLFNVELEKLMQSCICYAAYPCIPRPEQRFIAGIQSSLSSSTGRPAASRVVLERITSPRSLLPLMRLCGTFPVQAGTIDPQIVSLISNHVPKETDLFAPIML